MEKIEAATGAFLWKKVFLKIHIKTPVPESFLNFKLEAASAHTSVTSLKKDSGTGVFL